MNTTTTLTRRMTRSLIASLVVFAALFSAGSVRAQVSTTEADYYKIVTLPIPEGVVLEVGGLDVLPDGQLAVSTRRGDIWLVKNPTMEGPARPEFKRFAHGMHEALGVAYRDGVIYSAQRGELTRLTDVDGDGEADKYETVYSWPLEGNYHEYSFGPLIKPDGTMIVTLNLAWVGYGASLSKWRGWMLEITPDGEMTPIATGMRSPAGFGFNMEGEVFYGENKGDWIGSGYITHVEKGDFVGNPQGLRWTDLPGSPLSLKPEDVPDSGLPMVEVAKEVPELKLPAVWLPHTLMGVSTSDILADTTKGGFGPFEGQLFVGDQGQSRVMRVFLEKVNGVYQGAAFPFREGFSSGVLRMVWGKDSSMFVGMTSRGWGSTGPAPYGLQRLEWTGLMPFEVKSVEARPDGFELTFTKPVEKAIAADPASYHVEGFTYMYHSTYGSPITNQETAPVRGVEVAEDGLSARIAVDGLRKGYIHELKLTSMRSEEGDPLLHDVAYYTLNEIPDGPKMTVVAPAKPAKPTAERAETEAAVSQSKRMTEMPASWTDGPDATITIGTQPGLQFDLPAFDVQAGSKLKLVFNNDDDMMHNLLIVEPGAADKVGEQAIALGLAGPNQSYIPEMDEVLFHTVLLEPDSMEAIYFTVPTEPGEYQYVCSFPGHSFTMRGVMRVVER
ncbi:MAG: plastocyanin/azurin family copper-binding protein [Bacteroidetes bacterium]|nr:plastocyanin/azurin family copper-binding protein [Bacteroidota bacterium]